MAEYNGSIELISGIKPKNNGDFPLVNAPDVQLLDGRRLSEVDFNAIGQPGEKGEKGDKGDKGDNGEKGDPGDKGDPGEKGADGTSVTITQIVESDVSGGTNTVTFSDGSVLNVKNGEKGDKGDSGSGGGGGGDTFPVGFVVNPADFTATCDKTFMEIYTAASEGKYVYGAFSYMGAPVVIPFIAIGEDNYPFALFESEYSLLGIKFAIFVIANGEVETKVGVLSDVPPISVDLSQLESTGKVVERYANGMSKTTTIEFNSVGNPVRITDGDGNVTELTW